MIKNLAGAFEYIFSFLRLFLIVLAFIWMFFSLLAVFAVSSPNGSNAMKMLPSKQQPTYLGAWMQFFISGLLFLCAWTLLPLATGMSFITGTPEITAYSIGSYDTNTTDLTKAVKQLLDRALMFIGMLAVFRGLAVWYNISSGKSNQNIGRIFGYIFFGLACFSMDFINAVIANTLGFDLFGFLLAK